MVTSEVFVDSLTKNKMKKFHLTRIFSSSLKAVQWSGDPIQIFQVLVGSNL